MKTLKLENTYSTHEQFYISLIDEINQTNENVLGDVYKIKFDDTRNNCIFVTNDQLNLFIIDLPVIHEDEELISVEYNINKII
jgi:hypothetical protein